MKTEDIQDGVPQAGSGQGAEQQLGAAAEHHASADHAHSDGHTALHWLQEKFLEKLRSATSGHLGKMTFGAFFFAFAVAISNETYSTLKNYMFSTPACVEKKAERGRNGIILIRERMRDEGAVKIHRSLEERLPDEFSLVEACHTLQSLENNKPQASTADVLGRVRENGNAVLVVRVEDQGADRVLVRLAPQGDGQDGPKSREYHWAAAADRERMARDVLEAVLRNDKDLGMRSPDYLNKIQSAFPAWRSDQEQSDNNQLKIYERAIRISKWPLHEEAACEIQVKIAAIEFVSGQMTMARDRLDLTAVSNCNAVWKNAAHVLRGHSCMRMSKHEREPSVKEVRLKCAEAAYEISMRSAKTDDGQRPDAQPGPISSLRSKFYFAHTQFEIGMLGSDVERLRQSRETQEELKDQITDLKMKMTSASSELAHLELENLELGSKLAMKKIRQLLETAGTQPQPLAGSNLPWQGSQKGALLR